jgi:hypothetical protein
MIYNRESTDYFDNRVAKEYLEGIIYDYVGERMISNTLQITGPALERHLKNANKIADDRCTKHCIEIEPRIYREMQKRFDNISRYTSHNTELALGNVVEYERIFNRDRPCRFEDIDLCESLKKSRFIIAHRLLVQSRSYPGKYNNLNKCLIFTAALRPISMEKTLEYARVILDVIDVKLAVKSTMSQGTISLPHGIKQWKPALLQTGRLLGPLSLRIYSYKDTHPMMSCVILYK